MDTVLSDSIRCIFADFLSQRLRFQAPVRGRLPLRLDVLLQFLAMQCCASSLQRAGRAGLRGADATGPISSQTSGGVPIEPDNCVHFKFAAPCDI